MHNGQLLRSRFTAGDNDWIADPSIYAAKFRRDGYFVRDRVLSALEVDELRNAISIIPDGSHVRRKQAVYGVRNLLDTSSAVRLLASQPQVRQFVTPVLGPHAFAVRAIFFDKVADANWSLFWHQDNVVAVAERRELPGYAGWSQKAGMWQVQPPSEVLAKMVAVRIHLDDCGPLNGPLRVLPGSHRFGWLDDQLEHWKSHVPEVVCSVRSGGVVTMCPLTLHASARSECAHHRRVIHIEYAADELPRGLEWHTRIGPTSQPGKSGALPKASVRATSKTSRVRRHSFS